MGNLKSGSIVSTETAPVPGGKLIGGLYGSGLNGTLLALRSIALDARAAVGVGDPDVRRAAREDADAAADLVLARSGRDPVEADAGRDHQLAGRDIGRVDPEGRVDGRVVRRLVGEARDVEPQAEVQREGVADPPLVARVEAPLLGRELGRPARVGPGRVLDLVAVRDPGLEGVHAAEEVRPGDVLDEDVRELEELVVGPERDRVVTLEEGEVVGDLEDVLVEPVRAGGALGPGEEVVRVVPRAERVGVVADVDRGERHGHVAAVPDRLVADRARR